MCLVLVSGYALIALFAPTIADLLGVSAQTELATADRIDFTTGLPAIGPPNHAVTADHPFGLAPRTGDDNLAVWLYGARTSLTVAASATLIATTLGVTVGLLAGYLGGLVDQLLLALTDLFLAIPFLLAAIALSPILTDRFATDPDRLGQVRFYTLIAVLAAFGWMTLARLIRGEVTALRKRDFVLAAKAVGSPTSRILLREILPNLRGTIGVHITLTLPAFVAAEAGLSYLGLGVTDRPSWGQTIQTATSWYATYPSYLWQPLVGFAVLTIALNLLGDSIRTALDSHPTSRQRHLRDVPPDRTLERPDGASHQPPPRPTLAGTTDATPRRKDHRDRALG